MISTLTENWTDVSHVRNLIARSNLIKIVQSIYIPTMGMGEMGDGLIWTQVKVDQRKDGG